MATLTIPKPYRTNFKALKRLLLDDESAAKLLSVLREETIVLDSPDLSPKLVSEVPAISESEIDDIIEVLLSLYLLRTRNDYPPVSDFAEDICRAMDQSDIEELRFHGKERDRFKGRLIEFLEVDSVSVGAKALDIQHENERIFHSARIVTEIRPLFGEDLNDHPAGAVVVHMLRITYYERNRRRENERKDFFVVLDADNVGTLSGLLDRAESKDKNLRSFLEETHMPYIDAG